MVDSNHAHPARRLTSFVDCFPALRHVSLISFRDASATLILGVLNWPQLSTLELIGFLRWLQGIQICGM